jgi:hypothetical protein
MTQALRRRTGRTCDEELPSARRGGRVRVGSTIFATSREARLLLGGLVATVIGSIQGNTTSSLQARAGVKAPECLSEAPWDPPRSGSLLGPVRLSEPNELVTSSGRRPVLQLLSLRGNLSSSVIIWTPELGTSTSSVHSTDASHQVHLCCSDRRSWVVGGAVMACAVMGAGTGVEKQY